MDANTASDLVILYDKECPFCDAYIRYNRFREQFPDAKIVNAREDCEYRRAAEARGMDINEGMVVFLGGEIFHGADAMNTLSLITTGSALFNKAVSAVLSNRAVARAVYPLLNAGRKIALFLLGRKQIQTAPDDTL